MVRLQKAIADAGLASRRKAEVWIAEGRVKVNGKVVTTLGTKVDPDTDEVRVGRKVIRPAPRKTVLLHKPSGVISTVADDRGRPTVIDLLPPDLRSAGLYPAGRLDRDAEGLLVLTNDGDLAQRIAHPRWRCEKEYQARVRGRPAPAAIRSLRRGIVIDGRRASAIRAKVIGGGRETTDLSIVVQEGRRHLVKRMLAAVGHPVKRLRRVRVGPLELGRLPRGAWRTLSARQAASLKRRFERPPADRERSG